MLLKMTMCKSAKYLILGVITATVTSGAYIEPKRYDLIHYLLSETRYDHSLPPGFDTESVTNVSVEMVITDLNYESVIKMEYECTLYLYLNWTDKRLDFTANDTSYDNLKLGDDIVDKIWIPDLFFSHERKSELHGLFTKNQLAYIFRDGSVIYSGRFNIKSNCHLDLSKYPFDTQTCPIVIQSYAFTKDEILLHWNGRDALKIEDLPNMNFIEKSLKHRYCAESVGNFSTLVAKISVKRPQESFLVMYVVPPIILVTISFTSFLLGDSVPSRIIVPTGVLTQLIMQWAGIYNKLPPVSILIQLDGWMLTNLAFVGLILIVNAVICHFVILKDKETKGNEEIKNKYDKDKETKGNEEIKNKYDKEKPEITRKNDVDIGDEKAERLRSIGSKVMQPESEQGLGQEDSRCNEKSTLLSKGEKKHYTREVDNDRGACSSFSDSAFTGGTRTLMNGGGDPKYKKEYDAMKEDFFDLLDGTEDIATLPEWTTVVNIIKEDPRYKRVYNYANGEARGWYEEYMHKKQKKDFMSLLEERARETKEWERAEWKIDHDPRYVAADRTKRKEWFQEYRRRTCLINRIKWSSNVRSVNFICFMTLAVVYVLFVTCFYCVWSSDVQ